MTTEQRRPKVFIVNNKDYNLEPAKVFGDLEILYTETAHDIFMTSKHVHFIKNKLANMTSSDYLALTGNLVLNSLAFAIVIERFGFVNLLLFNLKDCRYEPRVVAKHQLRIGGENG